MTILCTIDLLTREVFLPADQRIAAYDHNVDVIRFQAEPIEDFSLDTSSIKIAAKGPNKARHDYPVNPSTVTIEEGTGYITFDWPIPQGVTEMPEGMFGYGATGQLVFAVCAEIISGDTVSKAWHSDDGIITVVAHLEPEAGGGEDPEEEATNAQKIGQLQTATAILQREISGIASGTPPTADSTDDMDPDESTVYINTTDGNWYYYDGSAWQIGGTYGGVPTDTTFTQEGKAADAKAVGDAISNITIEVDDTLSEQGKAADAKAVGDVIALKADKSEVATALSAAGIVHTSNNLIPENGILLNYDFDNTTGEAVAVASGYERALTDYIAVKPNTDYYGMYKSRVAFYDAEKTYLGRSTNTFTFTTPTNCAYVRLLIMGGHFGEAQFPYTHYLVEGNSMPDYVEDFGGYIPAEKIELFGRYKSVTNRLKSLYNPTIKTTIGIYGDSNTAGLESGATGQYYTNCWANLLCDRIEEVFGVDVDIPAFGNWGTWRGNIYSGTIILEANVGGFIALDFYGSVLKVKFGTTVSGVANITIDGTTTTHNSANGEYVASGLTEAAHRVVITRNSGRPQISHITVHKYVTAENKGATGARTSSLPTTNKDYNIYFVVYGTNDRQNGSANSVANAYLSFCKTQMQRGAEVIPIVPTPAADGFETGASAGSKMADIEAGIVKTCGWCNLEPISFYQYLLDYCTLTGTTLNDLLTDTLHLKETTHMLLFRFLCGKLGIGQPIADYLPT